MSAKTGVGLSLLKKSILEHLYGDPVFRTVSLGPEQGKLRAQLYEMGVVVDEQNDEQGNSLFSLCMAQADFEKLLGQLQLSQDN